MGVRCVGLGCVVVGLGSLVWWASVSVSGGCCVVLCGGGGGRGAKPRVGGCALGVGRCVFRGLGRDFAKMVHFRPSENLENNFRQHVVLLEYLPTRYCCYHRQENTREYKISPKSCKGVVQGFGWCWSKFYLLLSCTYKKYIWVKTRSYGIRLNDCTYRKCKKY